MSDFNMERPTNCIEFVAGLMNCGDRRMDAQAFIVNALHQYTLAVLAAPDDLMWGGTLHPDRWRAVAREIKGRMEAFYGMVPAAFEAFDHQSVVPYTYYGRWCYEPEAAADQVRLAGGLES